VVLNTFLPLVKLKHQKIASISSCVLAIAVHTAVVRIPAETIFFYKIIFLENFLKIRVKLRVIWGKRRGKGGVEERGEAKYT